MGSSYSANQETSPDFAAASAHSRHVDGESESASAHDKFSNELHGDPHGYADVLKTIASGAVDELIHHPGQVFKDAAIGAGVGLAAVAAAAVLPEVVLVGGTVAIAGASLYLGYDKIKHFASDVITAGGIVANPTAHTEAEQKQAIETLHHLGGDVTDFAAGAIGGGIGSLGLKAAQAGIAAAIRPGVAGIEQSLTTDAVTQSASTEAATQSASTEAATQSAGNEAATQSASAETATQSVSTEAASERASAEAAEAPQEVASTHDIVHDYSHPITTRNADTIASIFTKHMRTSTTDRLSTLQSAVDEITDRFGLPRAVLKVHGDGLGMSGSHAIGTENITLEKGLLNGPDFVKTLSTLTHELTHLEQGAVMVRSLADKIGIGGTATTKEMELLKAMHETETGVPLSDRFASDIIAKRAGRTLSADETTRAEQLITGTAGDIVRAREHRLLRFEVQSLEGLRDNLLDLPAWQNLAHFRSEWLPPEAIDVITQHIRSANPELDKLVKSLAFDESGAPKAWSPEQEDSASAMLFEVVAKRMKALRTSLFDHDDAYLSAFHEEEAHAAGAAMKDAFGRLMH